MTTTTTYQGMEPGSKSSSRVLRPPGGVSNISFGTDEETPVRRNKMVSNIFAGPEDPHAHRRNNPPGGKPTGVLCGESSAPLRRCPGQSGSQNSTTCEEANAGDGDTNDMMNAEITQEPEPVQQQQEEEEEEEEEEEAATPQPPTAAQSAGLPSGRRNPPGGKSSLILG